MKPRALKFVRFERIEDHLRKGWIAAIPNASMHHHYYGIEMFWLCECPVPGGFKISKRAFPSQSNQESAQNERATEHRT